MTKEECIDILQGLVNYHERSSIVHMGLIRDENILDTMKFADSLYTRKIETAIEVLKGENVSNLDLEETAVILRCLIGYHKSKVYDCYRCCQYDNDKGIYQMCIADGKTKCSKKTHDIYLEALEESLSAVNDRLNGLA